MYARQLTMYFVHRLFDPFARVARGAGIILAATCFMFMSGGAQAALKGDLPPATKTAPGESATSETYFDKARSQSQENNFNGVVQTLSQMMALLELPARTKATALLNRGAAWLQLGNSERAIVDFDASSALAESEPQRLYFLRGLAYEVSGNRERAVWNYTEALKVGPANEKMKRYVMRYFNRK